MRPFTDRRDAGQRLGEAVRGLELADPVVVLGLPRGGVPVAAQVADALGAPLDVVVVRKVGVPWQPELALGAVGEDGVRVRNARVVSAAALPAEELAALEARAAAEVARRAGELRSGRPRVGVSGRTAVVVDDGLATGATARAAVQVTRQLGARQVVLAVPVAPPDSVRALEEVADRVVALLTPQAFGAVGAFYDDFTQTDDREVVLCLDSRTGLAERPPDG